MLSYKSLKGLEPESNIPSGGVSKPTTSSSSRPGTKNSPVTDVADTAVVPHSTQYGSIASTDSLAYQYSAVKSQEEV